MRLIGISRSLVKEVESDVVLLSELFDIQRIKSVEHVARDIYAARDGGKTFVLTDFNGGKVLVDVIPAGDVQVQMLRGNSIKKLMEIKRGEIMLIENSLVGSALPTRP